jgi:tRNA A37 N6-isopentenylltransferase MiaA
MLKEGKKLHNQGISWKRMENLGLEYRYMARHLSGQITLDQMIEQLNSKIWQYARRQKTWFRRNPSGQVIRAGKNIQWYQIGPKTTQKIIKHNGQGDYEQRQNEILDLIISALDYVIKAEIAHHHESRAQNPRPLIIELITFAQDIKSDAEADQIYTHAQHKFNDCFGYLHHR